MNHTEVAQGACIRITGAPHRTHCVGCILQRDGGLRNALSQHMLSLRALPLRPSAEGCSTDKDSYCFSILV